MLSPHFITWLSMYFLTTFMEVPPAVTKPSFDKPDYIIRHDVFKYLWLTPTTNLLLGYALNVVEEGIFLRKTDKDNPSYN